MRSRVFRPRGYTLVEILVASSILLVLSVAFAFLMTQSRSSAEGGLKNIEARSNHRIAQQRITLLLRQAIAPNEVDPAIVTPAYGKSDSEVRFHAPANTLDQTAAFDPRAPQYPEFTLKLDPVRGSFQVALSDGTGVRQTFGRGFKSVQFERKEKATVKFSLTSEYDVRGAASTVKTLRASSSNIARLPGIR